MEKEAALIIRRVEYGDYDLILSLFSKSAGLISCIAKNARKSRKRFSGRLELFSLVYPDFAPSSNSRSLPVLEGVKLVSPFENLRTDYLLMGYASYWSEILCLWLEEKNPQPSLFTLFLSLLERLDRGEESPEFLSLVYQLHFLLQAGLSPGLHYCGKCGFVFKENSFKPLCFDFSRSYILCINCAPVSKTHYLNLGTVKTLSWLQRKEPDLSGRIQFSDKCIREGLYFIECFLSFHLGRNFRSLKYLNSIRPFYTPYKRERREKASFLREKAELAS